MITDMDELKQRISRALEDNPRAMVRVEDLLKALGLPPSDKKRLRRALRDMASDGQLAKMRHSNFALPRNTETVVGILKTSPKGFGFVVREDEYAQGGDTRDIFVPRKRMDGAANNDKVLVRIVGQTSKSPEGQVIEVLERGTREIVGTFYATPKGGNVIPRDDRFNRAVIVSRPDPALGIVDGAYVVAVITDWTPASQPLYGRVSLLLGAPDTPGIDVTMLIRDAGIRPDFPEVALKEAEGIATQIAPEEVERRLDLRQLTTFTMDGATAKDFDDALSIERLENGNWKLGVHIADVSYYVREGAPLDMEAYERGTSVYPVDRVVPMLPEKLSNNVCSLRPNEDRLTLSCIMEINGAGRVVDYSVHESIIRSAHRLIYEDVQKFMDGKADPGLVRAIGAIRPELEELYELRRVLTDMRLRRGALDLDVPETEVLFDDEGKVNGITRRAREESHRVVEECMLIANEVVASHLFNLHVPSVYRVHEEPDMVKLRQLQPVLAQLGVKFPARKDITAEAIQIALNRTEEIEAGPIARRLILRAMMQAHYHDENLGHYGLASACYTHFTSPIRRYPDLLVHRIIRETLVAGAPSGGVYMPPGETVPEQGMAGRKHVPLMAPAPLDAKRIGYLRSKLDTWTTHCSQRERRATDVERDAIKVKSLEYMRAFLGEEFEGMITSVTAFGAFVELTDMPVEGLIHIRNLNDDFYEFDDERLILTGKHTGSTLKLGDIVRVTVDKVNIAAMELDFGLVEKPMRSETDQAREARHRARIVKTRRQVARRPKKGGFQARGRRKGRR